METSDGVGSLCHGGQPPVTHPPPTPLTPLSPSTHAFARTHWCRLIRHMAWAMKGRQKRAKEVSGILHLCVCVRVCARTPCIKRRLSRQPRGQGPIDEIDSWFFFGMQRDRGRGLSPRFSSARRTHWFNEE